MEVRASFLGYMREHATSPDTALRPTEVLESLGLDQFTDTLFIFIRQLHKDGVIQPCDRGWYVAA